MKKILLLVLSMIMVMGLSVYAFAEDDICELSEEDYAKVLSVKSIFLGEKVTEGTLTQAEADAIYEDLENKVRNNTMRGLGFGQWLRESDYADDLYEIMPHKNQGMHQGSHSQDGQGCQSGERPMNGRGYRGGRNN
ncbi:hypothetical protein EZV73_06800 [Acidaminobacter sp. JC074]|uniref:hypothetical protein n=1 Tax=Acidaminobacter sp. JC074 TaxID=2530199 RepID=UPI001F0EE4D6|nr:hypothetical protein [Acidaminobacter sp. JC074]MCH4887272.1 hypothetical protein [Acidaminobacter sp. JC074]